MLDGHASHVNLDVIQLAMSLSIELYQLPSHFSHIAPTPAAFPAGVDPNRGSEETVRSPGVLRSANDIADSVGGTLSVASTSQTVRTNGHGTKTGVPPRKAGERRGACE